MARAVPTIRACCGRALPSGVKCECQKRRYAARKAAFDTKRPSASARGYDAEWRREREIFLAENPWCERCAAAGKRTMATVVNHRTPHRGNMTIFWDKTGWEPLCDHHHNVVAQSEERRAR